MSDLPGTVRAIVVVPCYNEAHRFRSDAFVEFANQNPDVAMLFVNDGSKDATQSILVDLTRSADRCMLLTLNPNRGKAEAVRRGIIRALEYQPQFVGYWDADLSTPLDAVNDFVELLDRRPDIELVIGSRIQLLGRNVRRKASRHYLGRVFASAVSIVTGLQVYDSQCGAKFFRVHKSTQELFSTPFVSRWLFDVELLLRLAEASSINSKPLPIYELPLTTWADIAGSKLRRADFALAALDLARIWRVYSRHRPHQPTGNQVMNVFDA